jgi:hypothetical protein
MQDSHWTEVSWAVTAMMAHMSPAEPRTHFQDYDRPLVVPYHKPGREQGVPAVPVLPQTWLPSRPLRWRCELSTP